MGKNKIPTSMSDLVKQRDLRVEELENALQLVIMSWDKSMRGDTEKLIHTKVHGKPYSYWSPSGAIVESVAIANVRALLKKEARVVEFYTKEQIAQIKEQEYQRGLDDGYNS